MNVKMNIIATLSQGVATSRDIAKKLGISRLRLLFAIRRLIRDGYDIRHEDGIYALHPSDTVTKSKVLGLLSAKCAPEILLYDLTDSTNRQARIFAEENPGVDAVFIANGQTAGRGRLGRSFDSEKNAGLYTSLLLHPKDAVDHTVPLTAYSAVAVCRALESLSPMSPGIKWVNDIYTNDKKLAGILTEGAIQPEGNGLKYAVIGIGINIATREFPEEIRDIATSVEDATGKRIDKSALVAMIIDGVIGKDPESPEYIEEYRRRSILTGKNVTVIKLSESYPAKVVGITDKYELILEKSDGKEEVLSTGELSVKPIIDK